MDLGNEWSWFFVVEGLLEFVNSKGRKVEGFAKGQSCFLYYLFPLRFLIFSAVGFNTSTNRLSCLPPNLCSSYNLTQLSFGRGLEVRI